MNKILKSSVIDYKEDVFFVDLNRNVYTYNVPSKQLTFLFQTVGMGDIANTDTKLFMSYQAGNGSTEYNITMQPFSYNVNRELAMSGGNAYCYKNDTVLIVGNASSFQVINMANNPPTALDNFTLAGGKRSTGDITYNPFDDTYIISNYIIGTPYRYYLTEYLNSDHSIIKDLEVSYTGIMGMFVYQGVLYVVNASGSHSYIYQVVNETFTLYDTVLNVLVTGASQSPLACTMHL